MPPPRRSLLRNEILRLLRRIPLPVCKPLDVLREVPGIPAGRDRLAIRTRAAREHA